MTVAALMFQHSAWHSGRLVVNLFASRHAATRTRAHARALVYDATTGRLVLYIVHTVIRLMGPRAQCSFQMHVPRVGVC